MAKKKKVDQRKYNGFKQFVKKNPDLSANELIRQWRKKGKSIGNEKGKDIIRDMRNKPKQMEKSQRFKYISKKEAPVTYYIQSNYIYLMRFLVEREGQEEPYDDYLHIKSNEKLTMRELKEATLQSWEDGIDSGENKYNAIRIIPESIIMIYAVDTRKK